MTREEVRKALLEESEAPKEIRTNDGRVVRVEGRERWAIGTDLLVVLEGEATNLLSIRNIASIRIPAPGGPEPLPA
jgi:hypothetical protein